MSKDSIRLSEKHGLNPSLGLCFYCGEPDGTVLLLGRLKGDAEAPRQMVASKEPCAKCQDWMKKGVLFIGVRDGEEGSENPYRTGRLAVVIDDAVRRMVQPEALVEQILTKRCVFIPEQVWKALGLPEEDSHGEK